MKQIYHRREPGAPHGPCDQELPREPGPDVGYPVGAVAVSSTMEVPRLVRQAHHVDAQDGENREQAKEWGQRNKVWTKLRANEQRPRSGGF